MICLVALAVAVSGLTAELPQSGKEAPPQRGKDAPPQSGKDAYAQGCASCHATGLGGAPKVGDHARWGMLIGMGRRTLYKFTIEGHGTMPARGGTNWPDATVRAAVDYMVELNK
jgi:cytochrome c5